MRLSEFIRQHRESLLGDWEDYARSIRSPSAPADGESLRDHASEILEAVARHLDSDAGPDARDERIIREENRCGRAHARQRLEAGYTIIQLLAEYRALRTNILQQWVSTSTDAGNNSHWRDAIRFNAALDQALSESVSCFALMAEERQQAGSAERLRTAMALRESEAKFRTIADTMPQMVWSTLPNGYHDYFNRQWYEFIGMPDGATDGQNWKEMIHPDDRNHAWQLWQHSLATGEAYQITYRLRHRSGTYRWTLSRALPVRDESGRIIRWMGSCTDIHDQKLTEQELQEASKRKDEFLAMLAHELRNPLAPISTAAQLLKLAGGDNTRVGDYSDILIRQVRHLTDLVDDLLDVSRVTRGLIQLEKDVVDMKSVLSSAAEQARPVIESRRHMLNLQMGAAPAYVNGDKTRLVQVIVNLLNNSAKYTPEGGEIDLVLKVIDGETEDSTSEVEICVSDNGNGIAPSLLPYVFDLFTQGQRNPDRHQGGLGLGLTLVKSITRLHGGRVAAQSEGLGKGSSFRIYLPLIKRQERPISHKSAVRTTDSETSSLRLMVVDDNEDAARSLATLLELKGHQVLVELNADAALATAMLEPIQVFILDIGLPGMDGYALARHLRSHPHTSAASLIALTGYGQPQDQILAKEAGFDHHFIKPIDTAKLYEILSTIHAE